MLPMPFSPASTWPAYKARLRALFEGADTRVVIAFWFFGLINNVLYVIILSSALDLVGTSIPKSMVLLFDVVPSLVAKLVAPYLLHLVPYTVRIIALVVAPSVCGMLLIALAPGGGATATPDTNISTIAIRMFGVMLASFASGVGELSFLGLIHYYGRWSLAAWGSGTGAAGLVGAGAYVIATTWIGLSVSTSLLAFACLPLGMVVCWLAVLPREILDRRSSAEYDSLDSTEDDDDDPHGRTTASVLEQEDGSTEDLQNSSSVLIASEAHAAYQSVSAPSPSFAQNLARVRRLFVPYMVPLLLVYLSEYLINQAVSPTLLFPLASSPFASYRAFYPTYAAIYQSGVFISRSSIAFFRIHHLYLLSFLQFANLMMLTLHALFNFIPSVWIIFAIIFWEGLLGGLVYVSTFAEIADNVPVKDREFSLSATSVSDSAGICLAGFIGMPMELWLCHYQIDHGRNYCKQL